MATRATSGGDAPSRRVREFAVGDLVSFATKHVRWVDRLDDAGAVLRRADGSPRLRKQTTPRRTRGEVVAVDPDARTLTVRTHAVGRLPGREVLLTATEAAGNGPLGLGELEHGYASTTTTAQGREWDQAYVVLAGSRLMGLEQTYTAQTRSNAVTRLYASADAVHAEEDLAGGRSWRDATVDALAESLVRSTAKVTTLDYATPEARAELEARFAAARTELPRLDAPCTQGQQELLERLGRPIDLGATWLEASVALDLAFGHVPGTQTAHWLQGSGLSREDAWRRVATALDEQERRTVLPAAPLPERGSAPLVGGDPHLLAIEELLAAPAEQTVEAAEQYRDWLNGLPVRLLVDDDDASAAGSPPPSVSPGPRVRP